MFVLFAISDPVLRNAIGRRLDYHDDPSRFSVGDKVYALRLIESDTPIDVVVTDSSVDTVKVVGEPDREISQLEVAAAAEERRAPVFKVLIRPKRLFLWLYFDHAIHLGEEIDADAIITNILGAVSGITIQSSHRHNASSSSWRSSF
jgi:hypothetical protein